MGEAVEFIDSMWDPQTQGTAGQARLPTPFGTLSHANQVLAYHYLAHPSCWNDKVEANAQCKQLLEVGWRNRIENLSEDLPDAIREKLEMCYKEKSRELLQLYDQARENALKWVDSAVNLQSAGQSVPYAHNYLSEAGLVIAYCYVSYCLGENPKKFAFNPEGADAHLVRLSRHLPWTLQRQLAQRHKKKNLREYTRPGSAFTNKQEMFVVDEAAKWITSFLRDVFICSFSTLAPIVQVEVYHYLSRLNGNVDGKLLEGLSPDKYEFIKKQSNLLSGTLPRDSDSNSHLMQCLLEKVVDLPKHEDHNKAKSGDRNCFPMELGSRHVGLVTGRQRARLLAAQRQARRAKGF
ncbi:hypothetical protein T439DRAFT_156901 [Meredithblackwellia eburnea MCA 4105]